MADGGHGDGPNSLIDPVEDHIGKTWHGEPMQLGSDKASGLQVVEDHPQGRGKLGLHMLRGLGVARDEVIGNCVKVGLRAW